MASCIPLERVAAGLSRSEKGPQAFSWARNKRDDHLTYCQKSRREVMKPHSHLACPSWYQVHGLLDVDQMYSCVESWAAVPKSGDIKKS